MNEDLLALVKKLRQVDDLESLAEVKELGESFLRKEKRQALLTLLAISEEMGKEEILASVQDLTAFLENVDEKAKP